MTDSPHKVKHWPRPEPKGMRISGRASSNFGACGVDVRDAPGHVLELGGNATYVTCPECRQLMEERR